jgi:hypothetical protein
LLSLFGDLGFAAHGDARREGDRFGLSARGDQGFQHRDICEQ